MAFPLLELPTECPVCAAPALRPLHVYLSRPRVTEAWALALIGCERCGVAFAHPLPTEAELDAYYTNEGGWDARHSADMSRADRSNRAKRRRCEQLLAAFAPSMDLPSRPRVFDFGCGTGAWLDFLLDEGWETCGLEPGAKAAATASRRHRIVGDIPDEQFDLVVVHHVLEHLRDPAGTMRALAAVGRYVVVAVPDFGRLPDHGDFHYVSSRVHVFSYTEAALRSLLGLVQFETVASDRTHPRRLAVLGRRIDAPVPLPPNPLSEAIESLRRFEPHEVDSRRERLASRSEREPASRRRGFGRIRALGRR